MRGLAGVLRRFVFNNRHKNVGRFEIKTFPELSPAQFTDAADTKLYALHAGLQRLKEADPARVLHVGMSSLNNAVTAEIANLGTYRVWKEDPERFLYLFSPHSGSFAYYFNPEEGLWNNTKDEHILDEHLVRELLKFTHAYLDL